MLYLEKIKKRLKFQSALFGKVLPPSAVEMSPGLNAGEGEAIAGARRLLEGFPGKSVSIDGNYVCMHGAGADFSGSTAVVVAHWDPQGIVDPYVVHMCRSFRAQNRKIILSSHAALKQTEIITYLPDWADAILYRTCAGYDFTSWKAALHCFPSLLRCSELVLCNDSVFGGIGSYTPMHEAMRMISCDFWGVTASREIMPHIQSSYLVFRQAALEHECFTRFFAAVPLSDSRDLAIRFELRLALWLSLHGLQPGVYAPVSRVPDVCNPSLYLWRKLLAHDVPMLKRTLVITDNIGMSGLSEELAKRQYPMEYISQYVLRTQKYSSRRIRLQR